MSYKKKEKKGKKKRKKEEEKRTEKKKNLHVISLIFICLKSMKPTIQLKTLQLKE